MASRCRTAAVTTHTSLGWWARVTRTIPLSPIRQSNFFGGHGLLDGTPQARLSGEKHSGLNVAELSVSGLGGVWAEENTRESIFAAMQRKETFGTSGPRIKVRFFGGWEFGPDVVKQKDWVKTGYANGVPMGGDLPLPKAKAPSFIVWAVKDPDEANLDRIQLVKGWTKDGQIFEKSMTSRGPEIGCPRALAARLSLGGATWNCPQWATRSTSRTPLIRTASARWN